MEDIFPEEYRIEKIKAIKVTNRDNLFLYVALADDYFVILWKVNPELSVYITYLCYVNDNSRMSKMLEDIKSKYTKDLLRLEFPLAKIVCEGHFYHNYITGRSILFNASSAKWHAEARRKEISFSKS
jgi:hypothetical protein